MSPYEAEKNPRAALIINSIIAKQEKLVKKDIPIWKSVLMCEFQFQKINFQEDTIHKLREKYSKLNP